MTSSDEVNPFKWPIQSNAAIVRRMYGDPIKALQRDYVRHVCDVKGWTVSELARKAGLTPATLTRFMNSPHHKPNLSATTLSKIERISQVKAPMPTEALPKRTPVHTLPVRGRVAAGLWRDVSLESEATFDPIPVVENPRYAGRTQYAVLVEGPSVNKRIPDGHYAICVAWAEIGVGFQEDQLVHVERTRGGLQEATLKVVRIRSGKIQLWPDSTDPRFQDPIDLSHSSEDTEVTVRGLVIGVFRHFS